MYVHVFKELENVLICNWFNVKVQHRCRCVDKYVNFVGCDIIWHV